MNICKRCGQMKPREAFYQQKRKTKKRGIYYRLKGECKTCSIDLSKAWQKDNPEKRAKIQQRYLSTKNGMDAMRNDHNGRERQNQIACSPSNPA